MLKGLHRAMLRPTFFGCVILVLLVGVLISRSLDKVFIGGMEGERVVSKSHNCSAFVETNKRLQQPIGAITPHHIFMHDMITDLFVALKKRGNPDHVILLAPNHFQRGMGDLITDAVVWEHDRTFVYSERALVETLAQKPFVELDKEVLVNDHSVYDVVPYIACAFPDTKITALLLKHEMSEDNIIQLTKTLHTFIAENPSVLVLGSIDFSHYLTPEEAFERDVISQKAIEEREYEAILTLGVEYYDSAPALYTLLTLMDLQGNRENTLIDHRNGADFTGLQLLESTSYFTYIFE